MNQVNSHSGELKRHLKSRHIQLIALGGTVGTGLFLGSAEVLNLAGPSMILGYGICGIIAFLIMRQLGEMIVEEPVASSFSHFAHKYWGKFPGFMSGWNCWLLYILVGMSELTAIGKYIQYWFPEIPTWISAGAFFILINLINVTNVRFFGEAEFWLAIVKIIAVLSLIIGGSYLLVTGKGGQNSSFSNMWRNDGFFPHGISGLIMAMAFIMFSFGGLEMLGFSAAEAENPKKIIPKAINQVIYHILIFYIGSITILLSLTPWDSLVSSEVNSSSHDSNSSPFVHVFALLGSSSAANILNFVVLTAALSVYNNGTYCNGRILLGMAKRGDAPLLLAKVNSRGVPLNAILVSAIVTLLAVFLNYLIPQNALQLLMSLVVSTLVINWAMISLSHLKFRRYRKNGNDFLTFKAICYPYGNYISLAFIALILFIMLLNPDIRISVYTIPIWISSAWVFYKVKSKYSENITRN